MTDDELRTLIRAAIQRHLGVANPASDFAREIPGEHGVSGFSRIDAAVQSVSFGQYRLERAPDDTMCLIEPAVRCNHCGFCKCHGH